MGLQGHAVPLRADGLPLRASGHNLCLLPLLIMSATDRSLVLLPLYLSFGQLLLGHPDKPTALGLSL